MKQTRKEICRRYRQSHKQQANASQRAWRERNQEHCREWNRAYRQKRKAAGLLGVGGPERHGMCYSQEYNSWHNMKARCLDQNCKAYRGYGGRGVTVCGEWMDFKRFFADMGRRPSPRHTLDRIDNNLGYFKENCRWATRKEQSFNRSVTRKITIGDEVFCRKDACAKLGISLGTVNDRLIRDWSEQDALFTPIDKSKRNKCYADI